MAKRTCGPAALWDHPTERVASGGIRRRVGTMEGEWRGRICLALFKDIEGAHSNNDGKTLDLPMSQGGSIGIAKADGPT